MSVRDRLERQERSELEEKHLDYVPRAIQTAQQQAGAVSSTRSREERRAFETQPEEVVRNQNPRTGMGHATGVNTSVRQRDMAQEYVKQERNDAPTSAAADYYFDRYEEQQAADQQRERDEQRRNQELIAKNAQQFKDRLRDKLLAVTYTEMGATDSERQSIDMLVRQNYPERFGDPDTHKFTLMKLRAECGIIGSTPKLGTII
jgi:hypothetical protein